MDQQLERQIIRIKQLEILGRLGSITSKTSNKTGKNDVFHKSLQMMLCNCSLKEVQTVLAIVEHLDRRFYSFNTKQIKRGYAIVRRYWDNQIDTSVRTIIKNLKKGQVQNAIGLIDGKTPEEWVYIRNQLRIYMQCSAYTTRRYLEGLTQVYHYIKQKIVEEEDSVYAMKKVQKNAADMAYLKFPHHK